MLKIGSVRWRGKCSRHPGFNPVEGLGAVRGACPRCTALVEIYACHQRMISLMRGFAPPAVAKKRKVHESEEQPSLFGEF